jgi:hypothetical protein
VPSNVSRFGGQPECDKARKLKPTQTAAIGITGNKLKAVGIQEIAFRVGKKGFQT